MKGGTLILSRLLGAYSYGGLRTPDENPTEIYEEVERIGDAARSV